MLNFKQYLERGKVLKRTPDKALYESLRQDSKQRIEQSRIAQLHPKFRFELVYDSIRELADAFLARDGYKTYSHEAAITYFKELKKIDDAESERIDLCRKTRHDSKYYGQELLEAEYAEMSRFLEKIHVKITTPEKVNSKKQ